MAAPTRELEKLIVSRKLAHGGNPVTRWMAANVAVAQDPPATQARQGQVHRPHRCIVALIMAIGRAILAQEEQFVATPIGHLGVSGSAPSRAADRRRSTPVVSRCRCG
jgi:phage terminase large subunit-like protein